MREIQFINFFVFSFVVFLSFSNCSNAITTPKRAGFEPTTPIETRPPDYSKLVSTCFKPFSNNNPIIKNGDFFAGSNWNDPHVLLVENQFVMYASADTNFSQDIKIYRFISADGINWQLSPTHSVFSKSMDPLAWDRKSVETPAVVYFKNLYYLFYTGYSDQADSSTYGIGYATSVDGINWNRQPFKLSPTNPSGPPDLNFMQFVVGEPAPVVFDEKIFLYFAASGAHLSVNADVFSIGLLTTDDGQNWTAPEMVLFPDQTIFPRATWKGYSTPSAVLLNNQIHLFYDVAEVPFVQTRIHRSVSIDGRTNWITDLASIHQKTDFTWADDQINGPTVVKKGTQIFLWHGGQGNISLFPNISMGIGLSICEL